MKNILLILLCGISLVLYSQNKSGYTWIVGNNASYAKFDGSTNLPQIGSVYYMTMPNYPYIFGGGHSNICDSSTGKIILICNGMVVYDTLGNIIDHGDSLVPNKIYTLNAYPSSDIPQSSIILPKDNINEYYIFISTVSDSMYNATWGVASQAPFDLLVYNVVDMNANGGMGKVIIKNKKLLSGIEMNKCMMQACRHSNGVDWWLLKQGAYNTNEIIRFLVTKDSIYGPYTQNFALPKYGYYDLTGQMAFSKDGKKFAAVQGKSNTLFLADFNRCTGELSNEKVIRIPIDSTSYGYMDSLGARDSISGGVCFSPNGSFIYISKWWNLYQYEINEPDSALAWYNIKRGTDTTWNAFEFYLSLQLGADNKIYIGKWGGSLRQFSVIDSPDVKGSGCNFCRKCFRVDSALGGLTTPPNMPDYTLGADTSKPCWPLQNQNVKEKVNEWVVYPNPTCNKLIIQQAQGKQKIMYNAIGQVLFTTLNDEIDVSHFPKGLYFISCAHKTKKVLVD
jgi:hypothetical protein